METTTSNAAELSGTDVSGMLQNRSTAILFTLETVSSSFNMSDWRDTCRGATQTAGLPLGCHHVSCRNGRLDGL